MAKSESIILLSEINHSKAIFHRYAVLTYKNTLRKFTIQILSAQFNLGNSRTLFKLTGRILYIVATVLLTFPFTSLSNPWLPEVDEWKYNLGYSKFNTPKTIKFYDRDLYFAGEKAKTLYNQQLANAYTQVQPQIDSTKQGIVRLNIGRLNALQASLTAQGADPLTIAQRMQNAKQTLYDQDQNLQILYNRLNNITSDLQKQIKQIEAQQQYLILSYHNWSAKASVEYGATDLWSYGINMGHTKEANKYKNNHKINEAEIFIKRKLYDNKGYIFTIQPKIIMNGPMDGIDMTAMLGKSHLMKRTLFGKPVEVFGYSGFGMTYFIGDHSIVKKRIHAEITSGIKFNDRTIIMNQESEDFNPELSKVYKRVLRSQFTIAQNLNFDNIDSQNKVYLAVSYFTIDSLKTKRHLSSGYSIGLWLDF